MHTLETNCPQLRGDDAELWQAFIARDVPEWQKKNYRPSNPKNWYKVYKRYRKEHKEEVARDAEKLRLALQSKSDAKEANVTRIVTDPRRLPKLPRDSRMVAKDGIPFKSKRTGTSDRFVEGNMRFGEGSRTKLTTGESVLLRARREAKEIGRMNKLLTPMGMLGQRGSGVRKAPQAMVDEHARKAAPLKIHPPRSGGISTTSSKGGITNQHGTVSASTLAERERRLRAIKSEPQIEESKYKATIISDHEDDDEDDDDLFGEAPTVSPPKNAPKLFKPSQSKPLIRREVPSIKNSGVRTERSLPGTVTERQLQTSRPSVVKSDSGMKHPDGEGCVHSSSVPRMSSSSAGMKRPAAPVGLTNRPVKKTTIDIFNRGGAATKKRPAK